MFLYSLRNRAKDYSFLVNSSLKVVATETESKTASTATPLSLFCSSKGIPSFL